MIAATRVVVQPPGRRRALVTRYLAQLADSFVEDHRPDGAGRCVACGQSWQCPTVDWALMCLEVTGALQLDVPKPAMVGDESVSRVVVWGANPLWTEVMT